MGMGVTFQGPKKYPYHRRVPAAPVCARAWRAIVRHARRLVALLPVTPLVSARSRPRASTRASSHPSDRVPRRPRPRKSPVLVTPPLARVAMATSEDAAAAGPPRPPRDTQQMYLDVRHKPLTVHAVEVKGDERTRPGLFARVLAPVYRAGTLDELRVRCLEANAVLSSYGIFDRVDILCDAGPEEHPDTANVVVEVVEKKKLNLKGGAYVSQSGEGSMEMSAGLNNALGFAEKLDVEIIKGHERSNSCTLAWNQPSGSERDVDVVTRAFQQVSCSKRLSGLTRRLESISVTAVGGGPAHRGLRPRVRGRSRIHPTGVPRHPTPARPVPEIVHRVHHRRGRARSPRATHARYLYRLRSELAGMGCRSRR